MDSVKQKDYDFWQRFNRGKGNTLSSLKDQKKSFNIIIANMNQW